MRGFRVLEGGGDRRARRCAAAGVGQGVEADALSPLLLVLHSLDATTGDCPNMRACPDWSDPMLPKLMLPACLVLASAACSRTPQVPPTMPYAAPGVRFSLTPVPGDCTRGTVAWEVPENLPERIEVQIDQASRTVFTRSNDRKGHEDTGPWVRPGLEFYLLDRKSGAVLAATQAGAGYCAGEPGR